MGLTGFQQARAWACHASTTVNYVYKSLEVAWDTAAWNCAPTLLNLSEQLGLDCYRCTGGGEGLPMRILLSLAYRVHVLLLR